MSDSYDQGIEESINMIFFAKAEYVTLCLHRKISKLIHIPISLKYATLICLLLSASACDINDLCSCH